MKLEIHKANTRGRADHGWLNSAHSFSFASYYNPSRIGFGKLRVLNDDIVTGGNGFGTHPHKDMEIVSIPLSGSLKHKDSEGNDAIISHGEVQIMSAGTGVFHSEYNNSETSDVNFLQIWIMPEKLGIKPRYDQKKFDADGRKNIFQTVVSPIGTNDSGVKINQQSYFSLIDLDSDKQATYKLKQKNHGVYVFLLEGRVDIENNIIEKRDAIAIENKETIGLVAKTNSKVLVIEVPLS